MSGIYQTKFFLPNTNAKHNQVEQVQNPASFKMQTLDRDTVSFERTPEQIAKRLEKATKSLMNSRDVDGFYSTVYCVIKDDVERIKILEEVKIEFAKKHPKFRGSIEDFDDYI